MTRRLGTIIPMRSDRDPQGSAVAAGPSSIASVGLEENSTLAHLGSTAVVAAGSRKRIAGPSTEGEDSIQAPKSLLRTVT